MIVLVKDIPAYAFSSGLNELVFATDQNKAVLSLTVGEKEILSETYIPDASGRITINDLQGLIEPYLCKPQKKKSHFGKKEIPQKCDKLSFILTFLPHI